MVDCHKTRRRAALGEALKNMRRQQYPATAGRVIPIGGPEHLTYEQILDVIMEALGVSKPKVHIPVPFMMPVAALMAAVQPRPLITPGQLSQLALDNATDLDAVERAFGFRPASLREKIGYVRDK